MELSENQIDVLLRVMEEIAAAAIREDKRSDDFSGSDADRTRKECRETLLQEFGPDKEQSPAPEVRIRNHTNAKVTATEEDGITTIHIGEKKEKSLPFCGKCRTRHTPGYCPEG